MPKLKKERYITIGQKEMILEAYQGEIQLNQDGEGQLRVWVTSVDEPIVNWSQSGVARTWTNMAPVSDLEELLRRRLWWEHNTSGEAMDFESFKERCLLAIDEIEAKLVAEVRQMDAGAHG